MATRQSIAPRNPNPQQISISSSSPLNMSSNSNKNSYSSIRSHMNAGSPPIASSYKHIEITKTDLTEIVTSKEWVLPPRPKPGRKPSIDTPATKRKAQNRAAQRAFRERRATRVQELEIKLGELENLKETREIELISKINKLFLENQYLMKKVDFLESDLKKHRLNAVQEISPISSPNDKFSSGGNSPTHSEIDVINQSISNQSKQSPRESSKSSSRDPEKSSNPILKESTDDDCGICIKDDCICEAVGIKINKSIENQINTFKPMPAVSIKKRKLSNEVDFTKKFSKLKNFEKIEIDKIDKNFNENKKDNFDDCGFCSDDSPCVCREAQESRDNVEAKAQQKNEVAHIHEPISNLPPIQNNKINSQKLPVLHPGPSVEIREISSINLSMNILNQSNINNSSSIEEKNMECTGNPGTCFQCQIDPMSTLFCTTIANKDDKAKGQNKSPITPSPPIQQQKKIQKPVIRVNERESEKDIREMFIPCADAYKTLSRHKEFNSIDFNTLVGKLTTRGMQVEVQSVANLLRELDRKLYN